MLGTRGDLSNVFSYDAYFQYGRTNYTQVYENEFSVARLNRALNVVNVDANGAVVPVGTPGSAIVCRSVLDNSDPTCVPYDPFGTAPSAAAVNYLNVFGVIQGITSEQIAQRQLHRPARRRWGPDPVGRGRRRRSTPVSSIARNRSSSTRTSRSRPGDLTGQGAPTLPVNGNFRVWEVFGEAQIPIVQNSFIDELTLSAGYRKSWYDLSNGRKYDTDTYKLSAEFAPIRDVRFRGAYNRAVRAPNIQELFAPQFVGLDGSNDPCARHAITATDFGCLAQGLVGRPDRRRRTRPASTTACLAATRT